MLGRRYASGKCSTFNLDAPLGELRPPELFGGGDHSEVIGDCIANRTKACQWKPGSLWVTSRLSFDGVRRPSYGLLVALSFME